MKSSRPHRQVSYSLFRYKAASTLLAAIVSAGLAGSIRAQDIFKASFGGTDRPFQGALDHLLFTHAP